MGTKPEAPPDAELLRRMAEDQFQDHPPVQTLELTAMTPAAIQALLRELQLHQIELSIQNDELRTTQERLQVSTARYFNLYDGAPVGYCTLSAEGAVLEANLTAVAMLGVPLAALMQRSITRFLFREDQDAFYLFRRQVTAVPGPHSCEVRMVRGDGTLFWAQLTATDVPASGPDQGMLEATLAHSRLVLSDLSALKQLEEDRASLSAQLHHARKLETLGVLAAGISHDFHNLLTSIMSNASAGSQLVAGDGALSHIFTNIESAALKAAELTQQMKAYAGQARWNLSEVDLDLIAREIGQTLLACLPKPLTFQSELADRLPYWKGDSSQIFQVLTNLVMNAYEAFPDDLPGEITLRTRSERIGAAPEAGRGTWVLPTVPGHYAVLEVADTGCGMTADHLGRAFEPFYTTKAAGRGLGLAAVHGILSSHGGGLWARSSPGQGTSIKIYLPAMVDRRTDGQEEVRSTWRGKGTILVVDFEAGPRNLARALLEAFGFTVLEARGGMEAVELFRQRHLDLVLVFLDLGLKGTSARETFSRIKVIDDLVPVVFTASQDGTAPEPCPEGGPGVLKKPYRAAEFQGMLRRLLDPSLNPA